MLRLPNIYFQLKKFKQAKQKTSASPSITPTPSESSHVEASTSSTAEPETVPQVIPEVSASEIVAADTDQAIPVLDYFHGSDTQQSEMSDSFSATAQETVPADALQVWLYSL